MRWIVAALVLFFSGQAEAQTMWTAVVDGDYTNSPMVNLYANRNKRKFVFGVPDQHSSAKRGNVFFDGVRQQDQYVGTAYVWPSRCRPVGFSVQGAVSNDDRRVTLYGAAPQVDGNCRVVSYRDETIVLNFVDLNANIPGPYDESPNVGSPVVQQGASNGVGAGSEGTVICLRPIFDETDRLEQKIDGNRETTEWVAQAINYLHARYCRQMTGKPSSGQTMASFAGGACQELSGMYLGERVYWEECHE